jgi:hypothetical protein
MKDLEPFPGKLHRGKRRSVLLNEEQRRWLAIAIREYPLEYIRKKMGVSYVTVQRLIDRLGLERGARFNGFRTYYKIHPEELKKRNEKIRKARMKLIKREKFNLRMGLHQETNVYVNINSMTHTQYIRRVRLRQDGYTVPRMGRFTNDDPMVYYYDEKTKRHKMMERNMEAEGYSFKPLPTKSDEPATQRPMEHRLREWML